MSILHVPPQLKIKAYWGGLISQDANLYTGVDTIYEQHPKTGIRSSIYFYVLIAAFDIRLRHKHAVLNT
jgi:hypothetical protein